jgi:hypothetical protein
MISERDREVWEWFCQGVPPKEIMERFGITTYEWRAIRLKLSGEAYRGTLRGPSQKLWAYVRQLRKDVNDLRDDFLKFHRAFVVQRNLKPGKRIKKWGDKSIPKVSGTTRTYGPKINPWAEIKTGEEDVSN